MPGGVRPPTDDAEAMIAWLFRHGAPRTGEVLRRLQHRGWAIVLPEPAAATQTELWVRARFDDLEAARAAAQEVEGRVADRLRWTPDERPGDETEVPIAPSDARPS
jgi:hypothetical protein